MNSTPTLFYQQGACSLGALISLVWLGRPFQVCRVEQNRGESPEYLELNALGEVPLLYADGAVITENVAILQHIAFQDLGKNLIFRPNTPEFDQLNRALGFLSSDFHKAFAGVFHSSAFHPDKKIQEEIKKTTIVGHLREMVEHANQYITRTPFVFDHPMIPDAYFYAMARWLEHFYDLDRDFKNIRRFQKAMEQDPGVAIALEIEKGQLHEAKGAFLGSVDFDTTVQNIAESRKNYHHLQRRDSPAYRPSLTPE